MLQHLFVCIISLKVLFLECIKDQTTHVVDSKVGKVSDMFIESDRVITASNLPNMLLQIVHLFLNIFYCLFMFFFFFVT